MMKDVRLNPHIYEINTRAWLWKLANRYNMKITLMNVPDCEWDRLSDLGFDYIWLMGVWTSSPESRKTKAFEPGLLTAYSEALPNWTAEDIIGSPYAIADYRPNPICGTEADIAYARRALHKRGMRLVLDFVPNHLAFDHPLVTEHPEFFMQADTPALEAYPNLFFPVNHAKGKRYIAYGKDPNFDPWTDTAQLNYFSVRTRSLMIDILLDIASVCDGVRCDMAMLVLNEIHTQTWRWLLERQGFNTPGDEFWSEAIETVRARFPDFCFIAEVYWGLEWTLQQLGFNFTYDKTLYDRLQHNSPADVHAHLQASPPFRERSLRFIENHDEKRALTVFGQAKMLASTVCIMTLPGMRFVHDGQIEGLTQRIPVQLVRARDEEENAEIRSFYEHVLTICDMPILHEGKWRLLDSLPGWSENDSFRSLLVWDWRLGDQLIIVAINFSTQRCQARVLLAGSHFSGGIINFHEYLTGNDFSMSGQEIDEVGLYIDLDAWQSQILETNVPRR